MQPRIGERNKGLCWVLALCICKGSVSQPEWSVSITLT